jgi:hypothetical protein
MFSDDFLKMAAEETRKGKELKDVEDKELNRLLANPAAFDTLSKPQLDRLRIITESEIETIEKNILENEKIIAEAEADDAGFVSDLQIDAAETRGEVFEEDLRKRKLLLRLIEAEEKRQVANPGQQPTADQERQRKFAECQTRIDRMKTGKVDDIDKLTKQGDDQESIRRRANMWDDGIAREEEELRKWL